MPDFKDHIYQAKNNLEVLEFVNTSGKYYDWQVTLCFYAALHFVNAHLAQCNNSHYRTHMQVDQAINPNILLSVSKLDEDTYVVYTSLFKLSKRSRYMVNENPANKETRAFFTHEPHLKRALKHLDTVLYYFNAKYNIGLQNVILKLPESLNQSKLNLIKSQ